MVAGTDTYLGEGTPIGDLYAWTVRTAARASDPTKSPEEQSDPYTSFDGQISAERLVVWLFFMPWAFTSGFHVARLMLQPVFGPSPKAATWMRGLEYTVYFLSGLFVAIFVFANPWVANQRALTSNEIALTWLTAALFLAVSALISGAYTVGTEDNASQFGLRAINFAFVGVLFLTMPADTYEQKTYHNFIGILIVFGTVSGMSTNHMAIKTDQTASEASAEWFMYASYFVASVLGCVLGGRASTSGAGPQSRITEYSNPAINPVFFFFWAVLSAEFLSILFALGAWGYSRTRRGVRGAERERSEHATGKKKSFFNRLASAL